MPPRKTHAVPHRYRSSSWCENLLQIDPMRGERAAGAMRISRQQIVCGCESVKRLSEKGWLKRETSVSECYPAVCLLVGGLAHPAEPLRRSGQELSVDHG